VVGLKDSRVVGERVAQDLSPRPIQITHNRKTSGGLQRIHGVGGSADEPERCSRTSPPARTSASVCKPASRTLSEIARLGAGAAGTRRRSAGRCAEQYARLSRRARVVADYTHLCRTRMGTASASECDYALSDRHLMSHASPAMQCGPGRSGLALSGSTRRTLVSGERGPRFIDIQHACRGLRHSADCRHLRFVDLDRTVARCVGVLGSNVFLGSPASFGVMM
jgi:hypothetical protein